MDKTEERTPFVKEGQNLAQVQDVINKLVGKLTTGTFWSPKDYEKVVEESLSQIKKLTTH